MSKETKIESALMYWHDEVSSKHGDLLEAKDRFLDAITDARDQGFTYARIADLLRLSVSRVQQLVRQSEGLGRSNR